jgi:CRP-like cAMP-binding protein
MADPKLSMKQKADLAKNTKTFKAGQAIIKEGEVSNDMFLLLSGKVQVLKKDEETGKDKVLAEITEPMSYFGEMAALLRQPRTATAMAVEDCEFMIVQGDKLDSLIDVSPAVGKKLIQTFAARLQKQNDDFVAFQEEVKQARERARDQIATAAQDYKRLMYAITIMAESSRLPQVQELQRFAKDSSMLASYGGRVDMDDKYFMSSQMVLKLHQQAKSAARR